MSWPTSSPDAWRRRSPTACVLALTALLASCGSAVMGPVTGSITLAEPAHAPDAVAFLRCRGPGLHGDITTDSENTRVDARGHYAFWGSLQFPTTTHCYLEVRHPLYRTAQVRLADRFIQRVAPIALESWARFLAAGPRPDRRYSNREPWPLAEFRGHLSDTLRWLSTFPEQEQRGMARYVPDIHRIYAGVMASADPARVPRPPRDLLRAIERLEARTAYPFAFRDFLRAVAQGDAMRVRAFLGGSVLRPALFADPGAPLSVAAANGHLAVIDLLLEAGERIDGAACDVPLLAALGARQWPAARRLIEAGADPGVRCPGRVALGDVLAEAARGGDVARLESFLALGAPADLPTLRATTALAESVLAGRVGAVRALLAAGADPARSLPGFETLAEAAREHGFLDVERALRGGTGREPAADTNIGEHVDLAWRRGLAHHYRVHGATGRINAMITDPRLPGVLWLAAEGGLERVDPQRGERRRWTRVNGLPASHVRALWHDPRQDFLWVATTGGLARLPLGALDRVETLGGAALSAAGADAFPGRDARGRLWFVARDGLYELRAESSAGVRHAVDRNVIAATLSPDGAGLLLTNGRAIWRYDPDTGRAAALLEAADLPGGPGTGRPWPPQIRSLAVDPGGRTLWVGTFAHGAFRVDVASGAATSLALSAEALTRCAGDPRTGRTTAHVASAAGGVRARFDRCFGSLDAHGQFEILGGAPAAGPLVDAAGDRWSLTADAFTRIAGDGNSAGFARAQGALGSPVLSALLVDRGRLLVGVRDAPLAVLDPASGAWSTVEAVRDVRRLRHVSGDPRVLALGQGRYWWVDPRSGQSEVLRLGASGISGTAGREWRDLRDAEFDGRDVWALRDDRSRGAKSRRGLYRLSGGRVTRFDAAGHYALGRLEAVVQDPRAPERLWLLRARPRELVDFDKRDATSTLLGASASARRASPLLEAALTEPRVRAIALHAGEALDPAAPGRIWRLRGGTLVLREGARIVARWPVSLPDGPIAITRAGAPTLWAASREGLVEFPLPEPGD